MHELSLALNIVDIAEREVKKAQAERVTSISLKIGECAGVENDAFDFAWPAAVKDSVLESAKKDVKTVPGKAKCLDCGHDFDIHHLYDPCPDCESFFKDIYQGKEFFVESLTVI